MATYSVASSQWGKYIGSRVFNRASRWLAEEGNSVSL